MDKKVALLAGDRMTVTAAVAVARAAQCLSEYLTGPLEVLEVLEQVDLSLNEAVKMALPN